MTEKLGRSYHWCSKSRSISSHVLQDNTFYMDLLVNCIVTYSAVNVLLDRSTVSPKIDAEASIICGAPARREMVFHWCDSYASFIAKSLKMIAC